MYVPKDTAGNATLAGSLSVGGNLEVSGSSLLPVIASGSAGVSSASLAGVGNINTLNSMVIGTLRVVWGNTTALTAGVNPINILFASVPANSVLQQSQLGLFDVVQFANITITNNSSGSGVINCVYPNVPSGGCSSGQVGISTGETCNFFAIGTAKF
jgi:hypothetical protein